MNIEERLKQLFTATPEQLRAIDYILESGICEKPVVTSGPLLLGMSASAKLLGVSRATLWRMTNLGVLQKIEILPGSFRLRRADLEAFAAGQKKIVSP
jgi:predicted DNA-binding transcriptional regulator AlpA